jgi:hypothetical protein
LLTTPEPYFLGGDIFANVPMPVWDAHDEEWVTDIGPALLVDDDCAVCKADGLTFNFAPILEEVSYPDVDGFLGNLRSGKVHHLFHIGASADLGTPAMVADLQALFSVPRPVFHFDVIELDDDPREKRLRAHASHPANRRPARLDTEGRQRLKDQWMNFLRLGPS